MRICPDCGHSNIDGVDVCEQCQQPLGELDVPQPSSDIERMLLEVPIAALKPRKPLIVSRTTTVDDVLDLLVAESVGCVLVAEDGQVVGIFSERDVLMRINTRVADLRERPISEFMTPAPETLEMSDKIAFALHRMDVGGYRHVPIFHNGEIAGVISVRDILRFIAEALAVAESA